MVSNLKKEYKTKLAAIRKVHNKPTLAKMLGVSMSTLVNWTNDSGLIQIKFADKIDPIYNEVMK